MKFLTLLIEIVILAIVGLLPLGLAGAGHPLLWIGTQLAGAFLLFLLGLRFVMSRRLKLPVSIVSVMLLAFLVVGVVHLLPLPHTLLKQAAPKTAQILLDNHRVPENVPLDAQAAQAGEAPDNIQAVGPIPRHPISIAREKTLQNVLTYATCFVVFLGIVTIVRTRGQVMRFGAILVLSMTCAALLGIAQEDPYNEQVLFRYNVKQFTSHPDIEFRPNLPPAFSAGYGRLFPRGSKPREAPLSGDERYLVHKEAPDDYLDDTLWLQEDVRSPDVLGPFPTRNALGAYVNLGLPIAIAYLAGLLAIRKTDWASTGGLLHSREGNMVLLLILTIGVCLFTVLLHGAWLTLLILLGQMLFFGLAWMYRRSIPKQIAVAVLLIAAAIGIGYAIANWEPVRLVDETSELKDNTSLLKTFIVPKLHYFSQQREPAWEAARSIAADHRLLGSGLGTYRDLYPLYAPGQHDRVMLFARSYPLTLLAETGLIGAALILGVIVIVFIRGVIAHFRTENILTRRMIMGLTVSVAGAMVAVALGFEMQMPGFAVAFWGVVAIAYVIACGRFERPTPDTAQDAPGSPPRIHAPHSFRLPEVRLPGGRTPAIVAGLLAIAVAGAMLWGTAMVGPSIYLDRTLSALTTDRTFDPQTGSAEFKQTSSPGLRSIFEGSYTKSQWVAHHLSAWPDGLRYRLGHLAWMLGYPNNIELAGNVANFDSNWVRSSLAHTHQAARLSPMNPVYRQSLVGLYRFLEVYAEQLMRTGTPEQKSAFLRAAGIDVPVELSDEELNDKLQREMVRYRRQERIAEKRLERLAPRHPLLVSRRIYDNLQRIAELRGRISTALASERETLVKEGQALVDRTRELIGYFMDVENERYFTMGVILLSECYLTQSATRSDYLNAIPDTLESHAMAARIFRDEFNFTDYAREEEQAAIEAGQKILGEGRQTPATYYHMGRVYQVHEKGQHIERACDYLTLAALSYPDGGEHKFRYLIDAAECAVDLATNLTRQVDALAESDGPEDRARLQQLRRRIEHLTARSLDLLKTAERLRPGDSEITELLTRIDTGYGIEKSP